MPDRQITEAQVNAADLVVLFAGVGSLTVASNRTPDEVVALLRNIADNVETGMIPVNS